MVVLRMRLEVLGELIDSVGKECHLHFRRTRVARMQFVVFDDLRFCFFALRQSVVLLQTFKWYHTLLGSLENDLRLHHADAGVPDPLGYGPHGEESLPPIDELDPIALRRLEIAKENALTV